MTIEQFINYYLMLSILIPVYNFDVRTLTYDLHNQAENLKIEYEIILLDDKSSADFKSKNQELKKLSNLTYIELPVNVGRSKIRNLLAGKSKFNNLIFMDCDSETENQNYIKNYLPYCKPNTLVYGGRTYKKKPPEDKALYLRWLYGQKREVVNAEIRSQNPNKSFMTNNFLISKQLFEQIKFDETITTYGHEDTIFGYELKKRGVKITHINNPLIHIGLETNEHFLRKTKQGIENLKYLSKKFESEADFFDDVKILKYYKIVKKFRLKFLVKFFFNTFSKLIYRNLKGKNPNLKLFDFYKLNSLLTIQDSK